jgi:multimeric flavodoxin WrbA
MVEVLKSLLDSKIALIATPVFFGMPSALMKKALDRTIPLIHPYIEIHHGESHHRKRYAAYPKIALYADSGGDADSYALIDQWVHRYSRNFHGPVVFSGNESTPAEEVASALGSV